MIARDDLAGIRVGLVLTCDYLEVSFVVERLWQFLTALVGAGIGAALVDWMKRRDIWRKDHQIEVFREQMSKLYGPLYYYTSQNEILFGLDRRIHEAYDAEYIKKEYSDDPLTRTRLGTAAEKTLDLANAYIEQVESNNDRIASLLSNAFGYVDPEDVETLAAFAENYIRNQNEWRKGQKLATPPEIYEHLGNISFMKPGFIAFAKERFEAKANEIRALSGVKPRRLSRKRNPC